MLISITIIIFILHAIKLTLSNVNYLAQKHTLRRLQKQNLNPALLASPIPYTPFIVTEFLPCVVTGAPALYRACHMDVVGETDIQHIITYKMYFLASPIPPL